MMARGKRILAWALSLALLAGMLPGAAFAATDGNAAPNLPTPDSVSVTDPGYSFDTSSGKLTISSNGGTTAWRSAGIDTIEVTSVEVQSGVTEIGENAFNLCQNLEQISLPDSLTSIGKGAFYFCSKLALTKLPDNLTSIGQEAFWFCGSLALTSFPDKLTSIEYGAFGDCSGLTSLTFPHTVAPTLGQDVFGGSPNLTIFVPYRASGYDTGNWAQYTDKVVSGAALSGLDIDGTLDPAFHPGTCAYSDTVPNNMDIVTVIPTAHASETITVNGNSVASGQPARFSLTAGETKNITIIAKNSDEDSRTYTIAVTREAAVGTSGYSFSNGTLTITTNDGTTAWRADPSIDKTAVTSVVVRDGVTEIGEGAFSQCINLERTSLPDSLTSIGKEAFYLCGGLELTSLPDKVTSIGMQAFYSCRSLTSLTFPHTTAPTLGQDVFGDTPNLTIYVPYGASGYTAANHWPMDKVVVTSPVTTQAVPGVTAPARGASPVTAITETAQYTGTVTWSPNPGAAFAADTAYTATITLTPKPGYTLQDVTANFFTVAGATATNAQNSGVITARFPRTGIDPVYSIRASTAALDFGAITVGGTPPAEQTVTVENTGNQSVTLTQPTATGYDVGALSKTTLAPGETASFTVRPQAGLSVGAYSRTLTVAPDQGAAVTVNLSFTVQERESSGSGGGGSADRSDDDAPSPTERAVSKAEKAKDGDTVNLNLPSNGKLPNEILEAAAGKDVTLEIDAGKGVTWIINGRDLPKGKLSDLNLKVDANANTIPVTVMNAVTGEQKVMQLALSHDGPFPFALTLRVETGRENAGLFANLYYYNEAAKALDYQFTAKIGADGNADLPFAHASSYAVIIDKESHAPANPFTDVKESDWFFSTVLYAYHGGLMQGTSATTFRPQGAVTRAQQAAILYRLAGSPASPGEGFAFTDIPSGAYYAEAVRWCAGKGLLSGYGGGLFGPNDPITREQLAAALYRYAKYKVWDVSMGEDANILSYADAAQVSEWAIPAMQWACGAGIMEGATGSRLAPKAGATRAELAQMLMRLNAFAA